MLSHRAPICAALRQSGQMWRTYSTLSRTTTSRIQPTVSAAASSSATASLLQARPSSQPTEPSSSLVIGLARRPRHPVKGTLGHHLHEVPEALGLLQSARPDEAV